jgi:hypothetical protein
MTDDRVRRICVGLFQAHYAYERQLNELRQLQRQGVALDEELVEELAGLDPARFAYEASKVRRCHRRD